MNDFLPENYTQPASNGGYLKLEKGETKFRFISSPITGWIYFTPDLEDKDGKLSVHHLKPTDKTPAQHLKAKHFWAAIVWDYKSSSLKILKITQKTVQNMILSLNANKSWGNPKEYDICITREGDGMDTEYQVMPEPKTSIDAEIILKAKEIDLDALYDNKDPFEYVKL